MFARTTIDCNLVLVFRFCFSPLLIFVVVGSFAVIIFFLSFYLTLRSTLHTSTTPPARQFSNINGKFVKRLPCGSKR